MLRDWTATLAACLLAGATGMFAQESAPAPAPEQGPAPPAAESTTLTGCVEEAQTISGGKAYILNEAEGGSAKLYVLRGQEFEPHINHKVEVTGQVQEPPPSAENGPQDTKVLRPPIMDVESLKMVANACK